MGINRKVANIIPAGCTNEENSLGELLTSLIKIREQQWVLHNFDKDEINEMIEYICTS